MGISDTITNFTRAKLLSAEQNFKHLFSIPFLEILEESVLFDENKQVFVQDVGEDNWMMTITFLLLFFISLFYGILVTLLKVSETEVAYTEIC